MTDRARSADPSAAAPEVGVTLTRPRRRSPLRPLRIYGVIVALYALLMGWWIVFFSQQGERVLGELASRGVELSPAEAEAVREVAGESMRMFLFEGGTIGVLLLASVWFVLRAVRSELDLHRQQANFVSAVTHELRSPIASARLYVDSILMGRTDAEKTERYLRHARQDLDRLSHQVEEVLLLRRLASDGLVLRKETVDLSRLVRRWVEAHQPRAAAAGATLRADATVPVPAEVDVEMLEKILDNLVSTAFKYGGEEPEVVVVSVADGRHARLLVRDHGPGLGDMDPARAVEPFVRGGDEDVRTQVGAGLGLTIVRDITAAHGGTFALRESPAGGTEARVELPLGDAAALDTAPDDAAEVEA